MKRPISGIFTVFYRIWEKHRKEGREWRKQKKPNSVGCANMGLSFVFVFIIHQFIGSMQIVMWIFSVANGEDEKRNIHFEQCSISFQWFNYINIFSFLNYRVTLFSTTSGFWSQYMRLLHFFKSLFVCFYSNCSNYTNILSQDIVVVFCLFFHFINSNHSTNISVQKRFYCLLIKHLIASHVIIWYALESWIVSCKLSTYVPISFG